MKTQLIVFFSVLLLCYEVNSQEEIKGNYIIYLNENGESMNKNVPLILEEERDTIEVLYTINGNDATKKSKKFNVVDSSFSFKDSNSDFSYSSIIVDVEQKGDKLFIHPKQDVLKDFEKYNGTRNRRLYIDVSESVKISKKSTKISAITTPLKVYISDKSDSLEGFTNNIETDVNIAITYGRSWEKFSFRDGQEPKLTNTQNAFFFVGLNKLELTEKNTDGKNDGDHILTSSIGFGYQVGYGKLGLSLVLGLDMPFTTYGKNWVFRRQPWVGIGIGYSIFK